MVYYGWARRSSPNVTLLQEKEMSELQHFLLGYTIVFILWIGWIRHWFNHKKNVQDLIKELRNWF